MLKNLFNKIRCKKNIATSYEEIEKIILSSIHPPMKPNVEFKTYLREKLLAKLIQKPIPTFLKPRRLFVFAGGFILAIILLFTTTFIFSDKKPTQRILKTPFVPEIRLVEADEKGIPVNGSINVKFPYSDIPFEDIKKHFSITPETEGTLTLEKDILKFYSPRYLRYETKYTLKVSKEASPKMTEDFVINFETQARSQSSFYPPSYSTLSNYTLSFYEPEKEVFVQLSKSGKYEISIYKVSAENLIKMPSTYGGIGNDNEVITEIKKNLIYTEQISIESKKENTKTYGEYGYENIEYVYKPEITNSGIYYAEFINKDYDNSDHFFFLTYTRYAISTKRLGTKLITWLVDMKTASGISDANITAYDHKEDIVFQGKTDKNGIFEKEIAYDDEEKPQAIVFETNDEQIVNILKDRIYGNDYSNKQQRYLGYIMTDRPLYKPGDTIKFKVIIRKTDEPNYDKTIKNAHIEATKAYYGESQDKIFEHDYEISPMGTFNGEFKLNEELKTGRYQLKTNIGDTEITTSYFSVEVYQKPDFEIDIKLDKDKYISGDFIKVEVLGSYFFGAPVKDQEIEVNIGDNYRFQNTQQLKGKLDSNGAFIGTFENIKVNEEKYYQYYYYWWGDYGIPINITATITEDSGKTFSATKTATIYPSEYNLRLIKPEKLWQLNPREKIQFVFEVIKNLSQEENKGVLGATIKVNLEKREWEEGKSKTTTVHTTELKTDFLGQAEFEYEFTIGGSYYLNYSVLDTKGNTMTMGRYIWIPDKERGILFDQENSGKMEITLIPDKLKYEIGEKAVVTTYLPRQEGEIFISLNKNTMRKYFVEKISSDTQEIEIPITEDLVPGFYLFAEIFNNDDFMNGMEFIEVSGKKLDVKITPSKTKLYPKENITLEIETKDNHGKSISSEGVITVIDKALLALIGEDKRTLFDVFYPKPNKNYFTVISSAEHYVSSGAEQGGCFLAGTLIEMADYSQKPIEKISVGDEILTKENEHSPLLVKDKVVKTFEHLVSEYLIINNDLKVTPVHRMFVNNTWKTAGEIKIGDYLMDKNSRLVQVFSIEKKNHPVKVYNFTTEKYHTYLANGIYVHNDKGGGGSDERARNNFLDSAYWNPLVENGEASFDLPDNLTTWVIFSKNITLNTEVGEAQNEIIVTKDLFIRPNLPSFFRVNDELEIPASIHNNTDQSLNVKTFLAVEGATILNEKSPYLSIAANSMAEVIWKIKINETKEVKLYFSVDQIGGNLVDNLELSIPVYSNLSLDNQIYTGAAPAKIEFKFDENSQFSNASLTLTASVIGIIPEIIEKLTGYPYGCVEQTMSKHLPNVYVKKYGDILGIKPQKDIDVMLEKGIERLAKFQHSDGGFGWWESDENNIWMTGYVLEGLTEMKNAGVLNSKGEEMYKKTLDYLSNDNQLTTLDINKKIYIRYVLSKIEPKKFAFKLEEQTIQELESEQLGYLALSLHYNGEETEAKRIMNEYILPKMKDNNHFDQKEDYESMSDKYKATGVNLLAMIEIGADKQQIRNVVKWLMDNRRGYEGLWGSTRQSSQILMALIKYIEKYDELNPDSSYEVILNGQKIASDYISDAKYNKKLGLENLLTNNVLEINHQDSGSLYYTVNVKNYVSADQISKKDNGLNISRRYLNLKDEPISEFKIGDIVQVELKIESSKRLDYVIIEDMLPSGFDPINERLRKNDREGYDDYYGYYDECYDCYIDSNIDFRDEKVSIFRRYLNFGGYRTWEPAIVKYRARVARLGTYSAPAPRIEPMYDPELNAMGKEDTVIIRN